ncbi:hypothetical protein [Pseudonocardia sp. DLS-67]
MAYRPPFSAEVTAERFLAGVRGRLRVGGRVLLFFGTSGDQDHVLRLAAGAGLAVETVATRELTRHGATVTYSTFRSTVRPDRFRS